MTTKARKLRRRVTTRQVSDYILRLLNLHGMSQRELGRQSGVDQKTINNLVREISLPRVETMDMLVAPFGIECWEALIPVDIDPDEVRELLDAYQGATPTARAAAIQLLTA